MDLLQEIGFSNVRTIRLTTTSSARIHCGVEKNCNSQNLPAKRKSLITRTVQAIKRIRSQKQDKQEEIQALLRFLKALLPPHFVDVVGAVPWSGGIALAR